LHAIYAFCQFYVNHPSCQIAPEKQFNALLKSPKYVLINFFKEMHHNQTAKMTPHKKA
jgi:hypothetical protein